MYSDGRDDDSNDDDDDDYDDDDDGDYDVDGVMKVVMMTMIIMYLKLL